MLLAAELADFLQEVRDNLAGTIADVDTEFLHDVRVAVRRTRSLIKLGRPALPPHIRETREPQFKWLGDLTTPVRDLDVYQLGLPEMAGWLVTASATDLEPFRVYLARRRAAERRTLVRALRGAGCAGCSTTGRGSCPRWPTQRVPRTVPRGRQAPWPEPTSLALTGGASAMAPGSPTPRL